MARRVAMTLPNLPRRGETIPRDTSRLPRMAPRIDRAPVVGARSKPVSLSQLSAGEVRRRLHRGSWRSNRHLLLDSLPLADLLWCNHGHTVRANGSGW